MSEEKKIVELKDKELEKVSGGRVISNENPACANYDNGGRGIAQYGDPCAGCKYWAHSGMKHYCTFEDSFKSDMSFEYKSPEPDWGDL